MLGGVFQKRRRGMQTNAWLQGAPLGNCISFNAVTTTSGELLIGQDVTTGDSLSGPTLSPLPAWCHQHSGSMCTRQKISTRHRHPGHAAPTPPPSSTRTWLQRGAIWVLMTLGPRRGLSAECKHGSQVPARAAGHRLSGAVYFVWFIVHCYCL